MSPNLESYPNINTPIDLCGQTSLETESLFPLLSLTPLEAKAIISTIIQPDRSHIILFPHSNTEDNEAKKFSGHRETPLTKKGQQEAQIYANVLSEIPINHIYHSPLTRSINTAQPIIANNPSAIIHQEKALIERSYGQFEGKVKTNHPRDYQSFKQFNVTPKDGESLSMVQDRIMSPLAEILQLASQTISNLAVITHANTTRAKVKAMTNLHKQHAPAIGAVRHHFFIFRIDSPDIILLPAIKLLLPNNQ